MIFNHDYVQIVVNLCLLAVAGYLLKDRLVEHLTLSLSVPLGWLIPLLGKQNPTVHEIYIATILGAIGIIVFSQISRKQIMKKYNKSIIEIIAKNLF